MTVLKIESVWSEDLGEVDVFMDENDNVVAVNNLDDAKWRHEYFDHIFNKFGINIQSSELSDEEVVKKASDFMGL
tara:strand:- start:2410 stop:2634 length:225 start_codon:yes stop_codon:yes gene_type:complete